MKALFLLLGAFSLCLWLGILGVDYERTKLRAAFMILACLCGGGAIIYAGFFMPV